MVMASLRISITGMWACSQLCCLISWVRTVLWLPKSVISSSQSTEAVLLRVSPCAPAADAALRSRAGLVSIAALRWTRRLQFQWRFPLSHATGSTMTDRPVWPRGRCLTSTFPLYSRTCQPTPQRALILVRRLFCQSKREETISALTGAALLGNWRNVHRT